MTKLVCKLGLSLCLAGSVFILQVTPITAQVRISEIMAKPSGGVEWIELHNIGPTSQTIASWKLFDTLASPSLLFEFGQDVVVESGEYLVIEANNKLNNDGDTIRLINAANQTIDEMQYTSSTSDLSWFYDDSQHVWQEGTPTRGTSNHPSDPSPSPQASPQATPSPPPNLPTTPSQWLASEVMSCPPSGQTEWLELYNPDPVPHDVDTLIIRDSQNNQRVVTFEAPAFGFGLITWEGSLLNNTGDTLSLLTRDEIPLLQIELAACQIGTSFIWTGSMWMSSTTPTPGYLNSAPQSSPLATPNPSSSPSPSPTPTPQLNTSPNPTSLVTPSDLTHLMTNTLLLPSLTIKPNQGFKIAETTKPSPATTPKNNQAEIDSSLSSQEFWPFLSVIMGGILLVSAGTYDLNFSPFFQWLAGVD